MEYLRTVKKSYYRDIVATVACPSTSATSKHPVQQVLEKVKLSKDEESCFEKRFPSRCPETQMQKRAIYSLLCADSQGQRTGGLNKLQDGLRIDGSGQAPKLSAPRTFKQPLLSLIVPRQDDNLRSQSSWSDRHWVGHDRAQALELHELKKSLGSKVPYWRAVDRGLKRWFTMMKRWAKIRELSVSSSTSDLQAQTSDQLDRLTN